MSDGFVIRKATPDDADAMSRITTDTFVETFGHLYPPQDLADYLATAYPEQLQRQQLVQQKQKTLLKT